MSRPPRGLSPEEAALWAKVAATVKPLHTPIPPRTGEGDLRQSDEAAPTPNPPPPPARRVKGRVPPAPTIPSPAPPAAPTRPLDRHGLDASWERKLAKAAVVPDFTLDLHGHTLDAAHARLDQGLTPAIAHGARLVLLVTGRPRPSDDHASLEMSFAPDGTLLSSQAAISIQARRISSDMFRSGGKQAAGAAGQVAGSTVGQAAKLGSDVFGSLASKLLRENVTEPGRIAYPAALRHNYNLLYQCVKYVKDPPKALVVEGDPLRPKPEEPKGAPENMFNVNTFGEAPKEEKKEEHKKDGAPADPAKP